MATITLPKPKLNTDNSNSIRHLEESIKISLTTRILLFNSNSTTPYHSNSVAWVNLAMVTSFPLSMPKLELNQDLQAIKQQHKTMGEIQAATVDSSNRPNSLELEME